MFFGYSFVIFCYVTKYFNTQHSFFLNNENNGNKVSFPLLYFIRFFFAMQQKLTIWIIFSLNTKLITSTNSFNNFFFFFFFHLSQGISSTSQVYIFIFLKMKRIQSVESYTKFTLKSSLFQEHLFKFKRRFSIKHPMLVFKNKKWLASLVTFLVSEFESYIEKF